MAIEYIFLDQTKTVNLQNPNFCGLQYNYDEWSTDEGTLEIVNAAGEQKAFFHVKPWSLYCLQRRNQSALQLHEVTPPRLCRDQIPWLFGFGSKHRCKSQQDYARACELYQAAHPDLKVITEDTSYNGAYLLYAFVAGRDDFTTPVAYYCKWPEDVAWAMFGKGVMYKFTSELYHSLRKFQYPLQYAIHVFKGATMSLPMETREFFQEELYIGDKSVYYSYPDGNF